MTGANGFIGRHLCEDLCAKGLTAYALLRAPQDRLNVEEQFVVEDYLTYPYWGEILKGMDAVIHTAGLAHVKDRPDQDYYTINTEMTQTLALECIKAGVKRFVFVSSIAVYGCVSSLKKLTPLTPPHPLTAYGKSKLQAENILRELQTKKLLDTVIVRPPLVYGPRAPGNIHCLLKAMHYNLPLPFANVKNKRSLIYSQNLCDALIACATHQKAEGHVFLVSDTKDVSTSTLVTLLAKGLNKSPKLFPFPFTLFQKILKYLGKQDILEKLIGSLQLDTRDIQKTLGWNPPVTVEKGLEKTGRSFR